NDDEQISDDFTIYNVDDNENEDENEILNTNQWDHIIQNWINMLDDENHLTNGERIQEEPLYFELVGLSIHPADDPLAK
ncbi:6342_t:CDS:2, partial [Ambispora leptoticha]